MTRKPSEGSKQEPVVVRKDGAQIYVGYDKECGASGLCLRAECYLLLRFTLSRAFWMPSIQCAHLDKEMSAVQISSPYGEHEAERCVMCNPESRRPFTATLCHGRDVDLRRQGMPGRYIQDDINKYPAKESIGPLCARVPPPSTRPYGNFCSLAAPSMLGGFPKIGGAHASVLCTVILHFLLRIAWEAHRHDVLNAAGITGGFAGGERGLQQLIEKGELKLAEPGSSAPPSLRP